MARMLAKKISVSNLNGFSLIEVLVALFLQAFGILGMTALQIKAIKTTHAALVDSQVQFLLMDMAERLHGNPTAAYDISFTDDTPLALTDCEVAICSSSELVLWDIRQWRTKIEDAAYLPDGEGQINFNGPTHDISIRYTWSQTADAELIGTKRTVSLVAGTLE